MRTDSQWLSADWGTSNFRLRLVQGDSNLVLAECVSREGVAAVFQRWTTEEQKKTRPSSPEQRMDFYKQVLSERIRELEGSCPYRLAGLPMILSGMATSTIGITTLPYQTIPCQVDGTGLPVVIQPPTDKFPFSLTLISGASSADDVMRGEETLLIGAIALSGNNAVSGWYLFPGTHSKHIYVTGNQMTKLRTYMTGELFALLSSQSILAGSVEKSRNGEVAAAFVAGVQEGRAGTLSHSLFLVRTADILGKRNKPDNYQFLSGLLIGHELRELPEQDRICLVGEGTLLNAYRTAIGILLPNARVDVVEAATALVHGQWQIEKKRQSDYDG